MKDKSKKRGPLKTTLALCFKEVTKGKNTLVAACARITWAPPKAKYGRRSENGDNLGHSDSRAICIDFNMLSPGERLMARIEAVQQFLHKASKKDEITIIVSDPCFINIQDATDPDAAEATEAWNQFCEKRNIKVIPYVPSITDMEQYRPIVACAQSALKMRLKVLNH